LEKQMSRTSTRGLWLDTRNGTVYDGTLRHAVLAVGGTQPDYHRCWQALRKRRPWPEDVPIRAASRAEVVTAKRTVTYELELVLPEMNAYAIEELVLKAGGWMRRVSWQPLPRKVRMPGYLRCTWLVSGLAEYGWLKKLVEAGTGRFQEVEEGQYRAVFRNQG
jgi:hypothetical protein